MFGDCSSTEFCIIVDAQDTEIARIADAFKAVDQWENTVFVFAADNGGPPYVANSNYPMRKRTAHIYKQSTQRSDLPGPTADMTAAGCLQVEASGRFGKAAQ